jgi:hypothetical protein
MGEKPSALANVSTEDVDGTIESPESVLVSTICVDMVLIGVQQAQPEPCGKN